MIPRIQGRVGQIEDPAELRGKWTFILFVSILGSPDTEEFQPHVFFDTEDQALAELRKVSQMVCESIERQVDGEVSGKYIDLKSNATRRWDNSDLQ